MDLSNPLPFIPVAPCRVADTRGNGFTGAYGPPSLVANANRNFTITGQCGIPGTAKAVSFNFGALNVGGNGDMRVFPTGGGLPTVSTLNYNAFTPNIANAAVVPLGTGGAITVRADAVAIDLIIDVNGYYYDSITGTGLLANEEYFGIEGTFEGFLGLGGGMIFGENHSVSGTNTYGGNFFTTSTGGGSSGVHGTAGATTGNVWGVSGLSESSSGNAAGVMGKTETDFVTGGTLNGNTWDGASGVKGRSGTGNAIAGLSSGAFGAGVTGSCTDTAGSSSSVVYGYLGVRFVGPYAVLGEGVGHFTGGVSAPESITAQPHPSDASKEIDYTALSGARSEVYFRGTAQISKGTTTIGVPEDFRLVASPDSYSTLVTPVGNAASVFVVSEDENGIVVQASRDVTIHYVVYGERDAFRGREAIVANKNFKPAFEGKFFSNMPDVYLRMMTKNGTLNPDGTVNAEKLRGFGWQVYAESQNPHRLGGEPEAQTPAPASQSKFP